MFSFGQNETKSPSVIDIYPHWERGEVHSVSIKSTTTDIVKEKPVIYLSTYNANFKVLEKSEAEYLVEWTYTDSKTAYQEPIVENNILAKLLNVKITIRLSNFGQFIELVNVEE